MSLAYLLLESGRLLEADTCYQGDRSPQPLDASFEEVAAPRQSWSLQQPGWPGAIKSQDYKAVADTLVRQATQGAIPAHLAVSELVRSVDCRVTELLYYLAIYPECDWTTRRVRLGFQEKMQRAAQVLPQGILQEHLLDDLRKQRNDVEHEFHEPALDSVVRFQEVVNAFFGLTARLWGVIPNHSMFLYRLQDSRDVVLQFLRREGEILLCEKLQPKELGERVSAKSDSGLCIVTKLLKDIEWMFDNDPGALEKLTYV